MAEQSDSDRWKYIRGLHFEYANFYRILTGVLIFGLVLSIGLKTFREEDEPRSFLMNLWTEFAGIAVTVLIIDQLNRQREDKQRKERLADSERQAEESYKRQLVDEAASTSNETAKHAVHVMRRRGWLQGEKGLLKGQDLSRADLSGAFLRAANLGGAKLAGARFCESDLVGVNFQNASLFHANLHKADLTVTNLDDATLKYSNMQEAILKEAMMQNADLSFADLKGAIMIAAKLQGANLYEANLEGAYLSLAEFDHKTRLPDGKYWSKDIEMERFTDPSHPLFWRSRIAGTPAYPWPPKYKSIP